MDYQSICAAIEVPLNTAFASLSPAVKIYFDNLIAMPPDPPGEYVMVTVDFGNTTEAALTKNLDFARGFIIITIYTRKGNGPLRARTLAQTARQVLCGLGSAGKPTSGVFVRASNISGPRFFMDSDRPHFAARVEAAWQATNLG